MTCTTRAPRQGEVDGVDYHFVSRERIPARCAPPAGCSRRTRSTATGTARRATRSRQALAGGRDAILKIDVQGAQIVKEQVSEALLIFVVPPTLETLFSRLRTRATETRRRARAPPAQRGDRARPPGRLRLRGRQRDRPGRAHRRADRRDHRGRAPPACGPARPRLGRRDARPRARARRTGRGAHRRRGRTTAASGSSRSPSMRPAPAARGRSPMPCRRRWPTSRTARPCSSSSVAGRRSGSCSARPARRRRATEADRRAGPRRWAAPAAPGARARRWIADHYLAPPALVVRAMLPPGLLERLELVAERTPAARLARATGTRRRGPRPARPAGGRRATGPRAGGAGGPGRAAAPPARPGVARARSRWTGRCWGRRPGPRYERWIRLLPDGSGRGRGARRRGAPARPARWPAPGATPWRELARRAGGRRDGVRRAAWPGRHGSRPLPALVRRGLAETEVRERPRRPLAARAPGTRGGRPRLGRAVRGPGEAVRPRRATRSTRRDPTPLLLDGVTGGGKTAIYVEAIAACLAAGRPALVLVPEIAMAPAARRPVAGRPRRARSRSSIRASGTASAPTSGAGSARGEVDIVVGTRLAVLAPLADVGLVIVDEEHDPAYKSDRTPRLQARDTAIRLAALAGAALVLGSRHARGRQPGPGAGRDVRRASSCRTGPSARRRP